MSKHFRNQIDRQRAEVIQIPRINKIWFRTGCFFARFGDTRKPSSDRTNNLERRWRSSFFTSIDETDENVYPIYLLHNATFSSVRSFERFETLCLLSQSSSSFLQCVTSMCKLVYPEHCKKIKNKQSPIPSEHCHCVLISVNQNIYHITPNANGHLVSTIRIHDKSVLVRDPVAQNLRHDFLAIFLLNPNCSLEQTWFHHSPESNGTKRLREKIRKI